jgi:hypothetical protein
MAKVILPKRSAISILDEKSVYFFYENILLVCESGRSSYGDEKILTDAATKVNASTPFGFVYKNYEVKMQNPQDNVFYFSANAIKQTSTRQYTQIVKKWYKHMRNAFAHNYIRLDNGAYVFEDYYEDKGSLRKRVLYARIVNLDDFKRLIAEVKANLK